MDVSFASLCSGREHVGEVAEQVVFSFHEDSQLRALFLDRRVKVLLQNRSSSSLMFAEHSSLLNAVKDAELGLVELVEQIKVQRLEVLF